MSTRSVTRLALVLLVAMPAFAADSWLSLSGGTPQPATLDQAAPPALHVWRSTLDSLAVDAAVTGVGVSQLKTPGGDFVALDWPEASISGEAGTPALPVARSLFVIPPGATFSLRVAVGDATLMNNVSIVPVQPPVEKLPGARENAIFRYDAATYGTDAYLLPERVVATEIGMIRGQRIGLLEIRPVDYNPARGEVVLYPDIAVTIDFQNAAGISADLSTLPGLDKTVLNPELLPASGRGDGKYLIIVAPAYQSAIASFASAKGAQGYSVSTYVAPAGVTNAQLKTYISALWGTPNAPEYILLVGDTDTLPHWTGGGEGTPATDIQYACMDGPTDWYPDIAIGRFPVRTTAQLDAIVAKTLYYEGNQFADPEYLQRAVFMASNDNYTVSEGTHNWTISTYMTPNGYTFDKLYCHTYSATTTQVRNAFNAGRFFGIYSGHGANTYWADGPQFTASDVNGLTNVNMYPLICSFACVTGTYTDAECFMETWIRAANKGAVVALGSSVNSYWTEDDVLQKKLFDVMFDVNDTVKSEFGPAINAAKLRYLAQMGSGQTTRRYFEMYNLMGDPALWVVQPPEPPTGLKVMPYSGLKTEGLQGGPFNTMSIDYVLENRNATPLNYAVSKLQPWVKVSSTGGTLPPGGSATVTVSLSPFAMILGNGTHTDAVAFTNLTDGVGTCSRAVEVKVGVPVLMQTWPLDTNPNWVKEPATAANTWAFGVPTGQGGAYGCKDPNQGHTGPNVVGYNLTGDYANSMTAEHHITTTAIDCTGLSQVKIKFWRWLGVESPTYDHARFRISTDAVNWSVLFENTAQIADGVWTLCEYDVAAIASNKPTVYLRWSMGTTDSSWTFCGWNIDDLELWGLPPADPACAGDMTCDGVVDFSDIDAFIDALNHPEGEGWTASCPWALADCNGDYAVDFADIDGFIAMIGTACP